MEIPEEMQSVIQKWALPFHVLKDLEDLSTPKYLDVVLLFSASFYLIQNDTRFQKIY